MGDDLCLSNLNNGLADEVIIEKRPASDCEDSPRKQIKTDLEDETVNEANLVAVNEASIVQLLRDMNRSVISRLNALENKVTTLSTEVQVISDKMDLLIQQNGSLAQQLTTCQRCSKNGVGLVLDLANDRPDESQTVWSGINNAHGIGSNITLIALNSEGDYPNGSWLGDESNPEMRVRVPISPSDLLHIHSNCRTAEKMALTLLDYLFDRDTQASSNLSGIGKHGKKQLDPLLIYGIKCHLMHLFNILEPDWQHIKQNIDSKCRTAFRRKVRGMPLTVKAFRGKSPSNFVPMSSQEERNLADLQNTSDESSQHDNDSSVLQELDLSQIIQLRSSNEGVIHTSSGDIRVIKATSEQLRQLQQTYQVQVVNSDHLLNGLQQSAIDVDRTISPSTTNVSLSEL